MQEETKKEYTATQKQPEKKKVNKKRVETRK